MNRKPKRIGLFWYIKFFSLLGELSEKLNIKEDAIYSALYRNTGYPTEGSEKILKYVQEKYQFGTELAYHLSTERDFKECLLKK